MNRSIHNKELKFMEEELVELDEHLILYNECENNLEKYNCGKGLGPSPFQYIDEKCTRNILTDCYKQQMKETTRKNLDKIIKASGLSFSYSRHGNISV